MEGLNIVDRDPSACAGDTVDLYWNPLQHSSQRLHIVR